MSGTVNAQIPLSFQPTPNVGPNFGKAISDANNLVQLQQFKQQVERANKLRDILGAPDAIDPATGAPRPDTLSRVMGVDPAAGMKLQQNTLEMQQHKLQMDRFKTDTFAKQYELTKDVSNEAYTAYKQALADGKDEQAARAIGQQAQTDGQERLAKGGGFSEEQQKSWPRQFDPVQAAGHVQTYQQWETERDKEKQRGIEEERIKRQEKRDEDTNRRAGAAIGKDSKGRLIFAFPNAEPGKRLQYGDGSSVPPEEEGGFTKVGTGAGAQKDADNAAIEVGIRKDHSDWGENQVKLERMRQVAGATNKTLQDPSKGWETLTDSDGNDYQHRRGTGENLSMEGEPYVPKGHSTKLAGPRAAAGQDRDAQDKIARETVAGRLGRPLTPEDETAVQRQILFQEDKRAADRSGAAAGAAAGARVAATGGTDRLGQVRVAREALQTQLGRPLTPADDARVEAMVLAAEDQRKLAAKLETPAQAAERDAMIVADKKIADKEASEGRPLDDAEKSVIRQESRSDPKVAEAARKKGETFGVPDTPEERAATAAQLATGEPITQVIPGWGKDAAAARKQARLDAIQLIRDQNPQMSATEAGVELANRSIEFTSGKKSSGQLTTMLGATRQGVMQLDFNIDKTKQEMKKLGATNLSPILNAIYRGEERWTGNPAYTSLFYYMNATAMESARILSGGQASIQQLHEGARKEAERWININMTPASFDAVAKAIQDEGHYRVGTFEKALEEQRLGAPKGQQQEQVAISPELQQGIDILKKRPETAAAFEKHFNLPAGSAQQYLKAAPAAPAAAQPPPASTQQPTSTTSPVPSNWGAGHIGDTGRGAYPAGMMATPEGRMARERAIKADTKSAAEGAAKYGPERQGKQPAATPAPPQPATPPARAAPVQGTAAAPLPLPNTEADLVDGGIYASDKGVVRFDKEKKRFFPVGGQ